MDNSGVVQRHILIVDDEELVRNSLAMALRFDGHFVQSATSADEALILFKQNNFDLVITDYCLGDMKGDALAIKLKGLVPTQPVVLISAYGDQLVSGGRGIDGVDAILSKPFNVEQLRQVIVKFLPPEVFLPGELPPAGLNAPDSAPAGPEL